MLLAVVANSPDQQRPVHHWCNKVEKRELEYVNYDYEVIYMAPFKTPRCTLVSYLIGPYPLKIKRLTPRNTKRVTEVKQGLNQHGGIYSLHHEIFKASHFYLLT